MKRAILLAFFAAACSPPAHSVDWFLAHPHDAAAIVDDCVLNHHASAECSNAKEAMKRASDARLKLYRRSF